MLKLIPVDWLRSSLVQGFVTCAGGGTETTLRSSRDALVSLITNYTEKKSINAITLFVKTLLQVLEDLIKDDRYAIPALETLAFMFGGGLLYSIQIPEPM
jgi:hypothetical protein